MANIEKQRERLINLLKELFQLDQPELDFGFYRIMHAKAGQVSDFLENDLLAIIRDAFGEADEARVAETKAAWEKARKQAEEFGAPDPDEAPKVKEAEAVYKTAKASSSNEGDVYDHLYRFFERYYDQGDFMSRRYFARETDGKAAPYAVPYDGREVYLHWANKDQYYIKTSEYLSHFSFDPTRTPEYRQAMGGIDQASPFKVHCRIVAATEGEHNNVKASEQTERFFVVHENQPVKLEMTETGETALVLQFEYKPLPGKKYPLDADREKALKDQYKAANKGDLPILDMADRFLAAIPDEQQSWRYALGVEAPTEKIKKRPLLAKYLRKYTARNTMDYFIHKDLGGFLRRELDFYIKNEVMRLDDIEHAEAPKVEAWLAKVKVLRKIARHLIDFLAQLEDFQKKLWLKKKFVVDTQYCMTLDRIPEAFYPGIAANEVQRKEWVRLFSIDELEGYSAPLSVDFLKANDKLLIDTALFDSNFRDLIVAQMQSLDDDLGGLLIHGENFQALRLLAPKFSEGISCVYIDPPYNTDNNEFPYKDSYKASSWFTMMIDRARQAKKLMDSNGLFFQQIGDDEAARSRLMLDFVFAERKNSVVVRRGIKNVQAQFEDISRLSLGHDIIHIYSKNKDTRLRHLHQVLKEGKPGKWDTFWRGTDRPTMRYELLGQNPETGQWRWEKNRAKQACANYETYLAEQSQRKTLDEWYAENLQAGVDLDFVRKNEDDVVQYYVPPQNFRLVSDNWLDIPASGSLTSFPHEKSLALLQRIISWVTKPNQTVLDYFAGSGSTGHAALRLSDEERRKYVQIEMGDYFNNVLQPRIKKYCYSSTWKDDKPSTRDGISHAFKYLRLESYEDALGNLSLMPTPGLASTKTNFQRDYMLHYWLNFETKGSPSLLNIEWFADPTAYKLKVKKPGTDEYVEKAVDLVETFNWLIGLHVEHLDHWRGYEAAFKREPDPELPEDTSTRLILDGSLKERDDGAWRFRKIEGYTLRTPGDQSSREQTLVIWRKLTGDLEKDNLMLDEWFRKYRLSTQDTEFDVVYVNGSNNLPNLRQAEETWKVRLIEEYFHQAMWDVEE